MPDWLILLLGVGIVWVVISDRRDIATAWRNSARWRSRDPDEMLGLAGIVGVFAFRLFALILGIGAVVYGAFALIT